MKKKIADYLWHGYLPGNEMIPPYFQKSRSIQSEARVEHVHEIWKSIVDEEIEKHGRDILVPLSGGWDSRLIISSLLERLNPESIQTITFGCPGQLDFELGNSLAKLLGTKHRTIDTTKIKIDWNLLLETTNRCPWNRSVDVFFNSLPLKIAAESGLTVWSGFVGDVINGGISSLYPEKLNTRDFLSAFQKHQKIDKADFITPPQYHPVYEIANNANFPSSTNEWKYLNLRCSSMISGIILSQKISSWDSFYKNPFSNKNGKIVTPFTHPRWTSFWNSQEESKKNNQKLFFQYFKTYYPFYYNYPSKSNYGLSHQSHRLQILSKKLEISIRSRLGNKIPSLKSPIMKNYFDYSKIIRQSSDWKNLISRAASIVDDSGLTPWLSGSNLLNLHISGKSDLGDQLFVILGLGLNIENSQKSL